MPCNKQTVNIDISVISFDLQIQHLNVQVYVGKASLIPQIFLWLPQERSHSASVGDLCDCRAAKSGHRCLLKNALPAFAIYKK